MNIADFYYCLLTSSYLIAEHWLNQKITTPIYVHNQVQMNCLQRMHIIHGDNNY